MAARTTKKKSSKRTTRTKAKAPARRKRTKAVAEPPQEDLLELDTESASDDLIEWEKCSSQKANIKVIGVGGGGSNALNGMIKSGLQGVEFIAANTDAQALRHNRAAIKLQLGSEVTRGLGCGADPTKGRNSALEVEDRLRSAFEGTDMVFVTAGLGGGTGTGAAPVVAEVAREMGALTVGVVTKPFTFEGKVRMDHATRGLAELHEVVDTVITIPNQRLLAFAGKGTPVTDAFKLADEVLFGAVRGIADLITIHGLINLDFADVRTIMSGAGTALMGTGTAKGEERGTEAARMAISSPLLDDLSIEGAQGVLINITGSDDLTLFEVNEASTLIQEAAHEDANIIFGAVIDEDLPEGEMRVTVIATGLDGGHAPKQTDREMFFLGGNGRRDGNPGNLRQIRGESSPAGPTEGTAQGSSITRTENPPAAGHTPKDSAKTAQDDDWISPFEDELDVPTFLRRSNREEEEEDSLEPAFLRRSAD
ncbi:cell division protein FtsZ [Myxococcota bacterium]|nr:cell division protein FtsZ [Myxococcota bacterium]